MSESAELAPVVLDPRASRRHSIARCRKGADALLEPWVGLFPELVVERDRCPALAGSALKRSTITAEIRSAKPLEHPVVPVAVLEEFRDSSGSSCPWTLHGSEGARRSGNPAKKRPRSPPNAKPNGVEAPVALFDRGWTLFGTGTSARKRVNRCLARSRSAANAAFELAASNRELASAFSRTFRNSIDARARLALAGSIAAIRRTWRRNSIESAPQRLTQARRLFEIHGRH